MKEPGLPPLSCLPSLNRAMVHILRLTVNHFHMEITHVHESDLQALDRKLPDVPLLYFKMVSVGKRVVEEAEHEPTVICDLVSNQGGHYLFGESSTDARAALHVLVDQFIDAVEGKEHESKS